MLSQKELKKLLHYDPDTGVFTRLVTTSNRSKAGAIAGSPSNGYSSIRINYKLYYAHRLAWLYMTGAFPEDHIDHINHIRTDNRWANLRDVTQAENGKNQPKINTNTSGVTGVCWHKAANKWTAYVHTKEKRKSLGYFSDKFDAICARKSAEVQHGFHENHGQ